ncbi:hypothetical protein ELH21_30975 (plasmid) [Rhizobium leguminosarum]|nr:hypothetical protein ELH21_30975 [Rhizobium leguminosarum]
MKLSLGTCFSRASRAKFSVVSSSPASMSTRFRQQFQEASQPDHYEDALPLDGYHERERASQGAVSVGLQKSDE